MSARPELVVGIDEVGRGPLAGPVAVCALAASPSMIHRFREIRESKQLRPSEREKWYARIKEAEGKELRFSVAFVSAPVIDRIGIAPALSRALFRALDRLELNPHTTRVLLDGGLHAPISYVHQKTIIRGDATETVIAMASVVAKVLRDRKMVRYAKHFTLYGFEDHMGYGTVFHRKMLQVHGLSPLHRKTFCTRIPYARS